MSPDRDICREKGRVDESLKQREDGREGEGAVYSICEKREIP